MLIFRFVVSEEILSMLRGMHASFSPSTIIVIVLTFSVMLWALSSKPKTR
jgi:hypothetical protein